jgi:DNA polymerase III alpha subunit
MALFVLVWGAIKGVGLSLVKQLLQTTKNLQSLKSIFDLSKRMGYANKKAFEI